MKRNSFLLIALLLLSLAVISTGCSSSSGDSNPPPDNGGSTATTGAEQASGAGQASNLSNGSYDTFSNLGNIGLTATGGAPAFKLPGHLNKDAGLRLSSKLTSKISKSNAMQKAASAIKVARSRATQIGTTNEWACDDGGTFTITETQAGVSYSINFDQCREDDEQFNGTYTITFTGTEYTFGMGSSGSPLTILSFGNNYATLIARLDAVITLNWSVAATQTADTITMTGNGTISATDYLSGNDYSMTYTNFVETFSFVQNGSDIVISLLTNGDFSESWTDAGIAYGVSISFSSFGMDMTLLSNYDMTYELSGSTTISFTNNYCAGGTFVFVTEVPIFYDDSLGYTTAGRVSINSGAVVIEWNSNGSVTVTDNSGSYTYANEYEMFEECDFAVVGEEPPPANGTGSGTASGSAMTITLTWGNVTDMDLHMNYYDETNPTGTTIGTAFVGWENKIVDLNGDGITDAELDYDFTFEGYGPEHITTTSLPIGYYVISVDSFSFYAETSATVNVTIQIGNTTFGPYSHTFNTYDNEGQSAGAWFAVADVVVDGSGNVTVQAHNPALQLWHDGAFGMAPAVRPVKGVQ